MSAPGLPIRTERRVLRAGRRGSLREGWPRDGESTDVAVYATQRDEWVQSPVERHARRRSRAT